MNGRRCFTITGLVVLSACAAALRAEDGAVAEWTVKREAVFAFASPPKVSRAGDRITVAFETQGFCDVTVAVEDAGGQIVRHLASGVLGRNAPAPFARDSKKQEIVWDGKDDQGRYVDDKDSHLVRVSLGLAPRFEKTLYWAPAKRVSLKCPLIRPAPEGVYVYDGTVFDSVKLFAHDGAYVRTVYPFPAEKLEAVQGLHWRTIVPDGLKVPLREGFHQATWLNAGDNSGFEEKLQLGYGRYLNYDDRGYAASTMAVHGGKIALAHLRVNRVASDGSTGGLDLSGPAACLVSDKKRPGAEPPPYTFKPWGSAFSPDGKTLYLSGYTIRDHHLYDALHAVCKVDYAGAADAPPHLFAGSLDPDAAGAKEGQFACAADVACDGAGRVYVADYMNDRVQVFDAAGKFLKAIAVPRPAQISIHHRTGVLYVFSWIVMNRLLHSKDFKLHGKDDARPRLYRLGPFEKPERLAEYALPGTGDQAQYSEWVPHTQGPSLWGAVDSWANPPVVWLGQRFIGQLNHASLTSTSANVRDAAMQKLLAGNADARGILLFREEAGALKPVRDLGAETRAHTTRLRPPKYGRQRLFVNPKDGDLILTEGDSGVISQGFMDAVRIDPESGKPKPYPLPFSAEDMAFDLNGLAYLRAVNEIVRYDPKTWREVPFDYGEERRELCFYSGRKADAMGALVLPTANGMWHRPGFCISPKGDVAVGVYAYPKALYKDGGGDRKLVEEIDVAGGTQWRPALYRGRLFGGSGHRTSLHVFDKHGQIARDDCVPGLAAANGIAIDAGGSIYVFAESARRTGGKPLPNDMTCTLMKFAPGTPKIVSDGKRNPVPLEETPARDAEVGIQGHSMWVDGAEWMYGGGGFAGKGVGVPAAMAMGGCSCWNCRFALDYFARSFVPEVDRGSVAVLDGAGNLVLRIGRLGNVDDGKPLAAPGGPESARSIGGDEVALFYAPYVATHTDRRLFIADPGNQRVVSVKLGYAAEARVALKDVPDGGE